MTSALPTAPSWQVLSNGANHLRFAHATYLFFPKAVGGVVGQTAGRFDIRPGMAMRVAANYDLEIDCELSTQALSVPAESRVERGCVPLTHATLDLCAAVYATLSASDHVVLQHWEKLVAEKIYALAKSSRSLDLRKSQLDLYIDKKMAFPISIEDFSECLSLSKFELFRWCKETLGCTPWQYLIERRLQRAYLHLKTSDATLVDVALSTGFSNQSHFSTSFRARFGESPKRIRKSWSPVAA